MPQASQRQSVRNPHEPRSEFARGRQLVYLLVCGNESVLNDVMGVMPAVKYVPSYGQRNPLIALDQERESVSLAA
jgi:hypothetical protein